MRRDSLSIMLEKILNEALREFLFANLNLYIVEDETLTATRETAPIVARVQPDVRIISMTDINIK
jgi:hypothetical protein